MVYKNKAKIRRLLKRAEARGETLPDLEDRLSEDDKKRVMEEEDGEEAVEGGPRHDGDGGDIAMNVKTMMKGAKEVEDLQKLEADPEITSKDRRTAKRKAEAIAKEATDGKMEASDLIKWYREQKEILKTTAKRKFGSETKDSSQDDEAYKMKKEAAKKLKELLKIENDVEVKAKDRRSAKRKSEAIAKEASDGTLSAVQIVEWYEKEEQKGKKKRKLNSKSAEGTKPPIPYIVFVGQLSYDTTKEELLEHIYKELSEEYPTIKNEKITIRLLTDPKTKNSRGMAFVEIADDPKLLYACLKLHHTHLKGRRINVERTTGGKSKEKRQEKLKEYRKEQEEYVSSVVDRILSEAKQKGDLHENDLDQAVIDLCKRHSPRIVQAAIDKFVESNGKGKQNTSAYFNFLLGKLATEGVYVFDDKDDGKGGKGKSSEKREHGRDSDGGGRKRPRGVKQPDKFMI